MEARSGGRQGDLAAEAAGTIFNWEQQP
jgi:hypothetical protein